MKVSKLQEIDLSKYKLAYFEGDSMDDDNLCQDQVMALAELGKYSYDSDNWTGVLRIALIPKDKRLTDCGGDDWNDTPAISNASGFYRFPEGTIFLMGKLGEELKMVEKV